MFFKNACRLIEIKLYVDRANKHDDDLYIVYLLDSFQLYEFLKP